jgi:hypothetical protein
MATLILDSSSWPLSTSVPAVQAVLARMSAVASHGGRSDRRCFAAGLVEALCAHEGFEIDVF